jgi:hypothetical protein
MRSSSSSSGVIAAVYTSPIVALRKAEKVTTNTARLCAASSLADTLTKLRSLSELLCYLTSIGFAIGDRKGVVSPSKRSKRLKLGCRILSIKKTKLTE